MFPSKTARALAASLIIVSAPLASAGPIDAKVQAAMAAEARPQADRDRDENRLPLQTLSFFGLEDDMRVLELIPGGGWYTRILAPVLADNGKLYVSMGTGRVSDGVLKEPGFGKVSVIEAGDNMRRDDTIGFYVVDKVDFGLTDLDMVLTFRNLHNFNPESRKKMNDAVYRSLKKGGLYGVVDHTRRHMQADYSENRRRLDPVLVVKEMLDAGFEFVGYSDLHYRPDDELIYEVGRHTVTGNTDRFTMLFRKP
mgnify:CR=1 FL=1